MFVFDDFENHLYHEGKSYGSYQKLGAHPVVEDGVKGTHFAVWAPNARSVSVVTDAKKYGWDKECPMEKGKGGVWEIFLAGVRKGDAYRFAITGPDGKKFLKSDPYAFQTQLRPENASVVCGLGNYTWHDAAFVKRRDNKKVLEQPLAIYEVHLGSWHKKFVDENDTDGFLNYRELGDMLADYVSFMGYTHVELMGICEYPFDPSWGYQVTGYYAPTARYGTPDDFRYMIDTLHKRGIGVIFDWVPAHFPKDDFALIRFDGTPLYESADPLRAEFPIWGSMAFDHGKPEVRSFLMSSAFYWINEFHVDALRVDAVAAMLYADFSRKMFRKNIHGGRINLESEAFLKQLTTEVRNRTTAFIAAEDSSIEQGITEEVSKGGLGFNFKWNMGWMHDSLLYFSKHFNERRNHHKVLTHTPEYVFMENFILVLSHDDVCPGKGSIVDKHPGNEWERLAGVKSLFALQFTHPGKKLVFMGLDIAQTDEWRIDKELDWYHADEPSHRDVMMNVRKLLEIYRQYPVLHADGKDPKAFEWINKDYGHANIISFIRKKPRNYSGALVVVCNFSPWHHPDHVFGVPKAGGYERIYSTYDTVPGGGGPEELGYTPVLQTEHGGWDGKPCRLRYGLRPFECIILRVPK